MTDKNISLNNIGDIMRDILNLQRQNRSMFLLKLEKSLNDFDKNTEKNNVDDD